MPSGSGGSYRDLGLAAFLDAVAAREPAPGGGAVAATATGLAASLVAMAARFSLSRMDGAARIADQADALRRRALALADEDAAAYGTVLAAYRLPQDADGRRARIRRALEGACAVPLEITEAAAVVATLAVDVGERGNANLLGDAATAAHLAVGAARSAAGLVAINARLGDLEPEPVKRAEQRVAIAVEAAERLADRP